MKMCGRSVPGKLGLAIVTLSLLFSSGQMALAAEEGHGNPGQFIEKIRKGLSGISKYFWSPRSEVPVEQKTTQPAEQKQQVAPTPKGIAASKKAEPEKAADKSTPPQNADKKTVKSAAKPTVETLTKPVEKTLPALVTVTPPSKAKQLKAEKKPIEDDKKKDALAAALAKSAIKKSPEAAKTVIPPKTASKTANPSPQAKKKVEAKVKEPAPKKGKPVLAAKAEPKAKPQAREVGTKPKLSRKPETSKKPVEKSQALAKQPVKLRPEQKAAAVAPKVLGEKKEPKTDQPNKAAQKANAKPVIKKQAKLSAGKNAAKETGQQPGSKIKRGAGLTIASKVKPEVFSQAKPQQALAARKTGTHIWLPNIGSEHSGKFGLTGIPANALAAKNDLERTDGRWVFAPYKEGQLPSIYGLSDKVHGASDNGVWVGEGRNWIYVFAKKRTYGSIIGGGQKKAAKVSPKKSKTSEPKEKKAPAAPTKTPKLEVQKQVKATKGSAAKPVAKSAQKGEAKPASVEVENKAKAQVAKDRKTVKIAKASKTGKGGNWTKVNGRWVYVPARQSGQTGPASRTGLARQVEKAPVTGGWIQRNGRWVYVAPQGGKKDQTAGNGLAQDANKSVKQPDGAKSRPPQKSSTKVKSGIRIVEKKPVSEKLAAAKAVEKKKVEMNPALKPDIKTGLAEGPDEQAKGTQITRDQKSWVRKNNRWVYLPGKTAPASGPVSSPKSKQAGEKDRQKPVAKLAGRQFYFFVPGQQPGTGTWYTAPVKMLDEARKIDNPANLVRR